ncbi:MAG: hypothetical protein WED05_12970 [Candidatus Atabeyarchaeum deiterrae]
MPQLFLFILDQGGNAQREIQLAACKSASRVYAFDLVLQVMDAYDPRRIIYSPLSRVLCDLRIKTTTNIIPVVVSTSYIIDYT